MLSDTYKSYITGQWHNLERIINISHINDTRYRRNFFNYSSDVNEML